MIDDYCVMLTIIGAVFIALVAALIWIYSENPFSPNISLDGEDNLYPWSPKSSAEKVTECFLPTAAEALLYIDKYKSLHDEQLEFRAVVFDDEHWYEVFRRV